MSTGKFITLEGGEGAGKSTQAEKLVAFLKSKGVNAIQTREVGGCPSAEEIRSLWLDKGEAFWDPMSEVMLIMAARREHLTKTVWPALQQGTWVVSDRFVDSTRAYQGLGQNLGIGLIDEAYALIAGDFWPDLTLYLDVPTDIGHARMIARNGPDDRYQQKNLSFHEILRSAFHQLSLKEPERITTIDASVGLDGVAQAISSAVSKRFGLA